MFKAIIFDLDGTLLNTLGDIHAVLNASLQKFSLPEVSMASVKKFVGNGAGKLVERAVGSCKEAFENVYADYTERFAECENNLTRPYDGMEHALTAFKRAGIKLAIITNKPNEATQKVYQKFLASFKFNVVLGKSEGIALKPDPETTLEVIKKLGIEKHECLFVGDGETDVQTAKNAGIKCVSVLWGFRDKEELLTAGADNFVSSFEELENFVLGT